MARLKRFGMTFRFYEKYIKVFNCGSDTAKITF